jgi:bacillopeptidase F (M6 metalloprotease family)
MSLSYVTKDKYNIFLSKIHELGIEKEMEDKMIKVFNESMEYDPEKSTYSSEKYQQTRENHLKKSGGARGYYESTLKAVNKYNEKNKVERNRKERERYHKKKEEIIKTQQIQLCA